MGGTDSHTVQVQLRRACLQISLNLVWLARFGGGNLPLLDKEKEDIGMSVNDEGRRPVEDQDRTAVGWTTLHSWIFLGIVALGLIVIATQNRYHYLSPLGLGKAYRIDKFFGGIQEFDPEKGWLKAQLQTPPQAVSMMPPSSIPGTPPGAMDLPSSVQPPGALEKLRSDLPTPVQGSQAGESKGSYVREQELTQPSGRESLPTPSPRQESVAKHEELSQAEKFASFKKEFPDFGKDEFQLANDDLYPDWKANVNPNGTWKEFLPVYGDFIQWWNDAGSPPEPGFKLWKDYLKSGR